MEIKIKALTPIWTGGVDARPDRLHETGIIGSMRWWYEAIVRGLGGYACDPTSGDKDKRCELSGKEKNDEERRKKMCPVCYLFGCGGWKRSFQLEVTNNGKTIPFQLATLDKQKEFNHWWLSQIFENMLGTILPFGEVILDFELIRSSETVKQQLKALLSIIASLGGIGAKTQYGFGQFDWEEKMGLKEAIKTIQNFLRDNNFKKGSNKNKWYSLDKSWFYEVELPSENKMVKRFQKANVIGKDGLPEGYLPVSFDIRYNLPGSNSEGLRQAYYLKYGKKMARDVFGTLIGDKIGSRVFVSHLFKKDSTDDGYWLRVWGFTENDVGVLVGQELKKMFGFEEVPQMIQGNDITGVGSVQ